ncbi:MAG: GNAT family N-acetyltransferase, partial [Dehalococcoidales bacterium]|nr:GNAT family N-acetyltransferase [Dehalococcoidales bacterium]
MVPIDEIFPDLREYRSAAILKDGTSINLRAIQPEDIDRLIAFFNRLSQRTVFLRFHYHRDELPREEAKQLCTLDYKNEFAIVATTGEGAEEKIAGVGRYHTLPVNRHAQLELVIEDIYQGKGVGTAILEHLAKAARTQGIRAFVVSALAESPESLKVLEDVGFKKDGEVERGIYRMFLSLEADLTLEKKSIQREEKAAIASLKSFLTPRSVAVIGASPRATALGNRSFTCLLYGGFKGTVYPVNSKGDSVAAVKAYS